jgi:predicted glycoside hydrolase/deacetylase ChbG (UPF0249 family)
LKRLIVHADDLGADADRNAGIFEAMDAGIVTAASILVNGPAFDDCVRKIVSGKFPHISFGVHLNLSEGRPLSPGLKSITGPDGCFCGKPEVHRRLMSGGDDALEAEIRREFSAQMTALRDAGIRIDHADGHQHVHIFPAAIASAVRAAEEAGVLWFRIPEEPPPSGSTQRTDPGLADEAQMFSRFAAAARSRMDGSALSTTDHFRGLYLKGTLSLESLEATLKDLPAGLTELMVHPGRASGGRLDGPFSAFSHQDRERELEVLTSHRFRRMLDEHQVVLAVFPEVRP